MSTNAVFVRRVKNTIDTENEMLPSTYSLENVGLLQRRRQFAASPIISECGQTMLVWGELIHSLT